MTPAMRQKFSDTVRGRDAVGPARRRLAGLLLFVVAALTAWVFLRDADWQARSRFARTMGLSSSRAGDMQQAIRHFEDAVTADPYDWRSHRNLADIQFNRPGNRNAAFKHYSLALAYAPPFIDMLGPNRQRDILALLRAGTIEEPADCLEDMFLAVDAGAKEAFRQRLSPNMARDFASLWEEWVRRGRGTVRTRIIVPVDDGYRAEAKLDFPGRSPASVDMTCRPGSVWLVERFTPETEK